MSTQNANYWKKRIGNIQTATHNQAFKKALNRNENKYRKLNSHFTLFANKIEGSKNNHIPLSPPSQPLRRSKALTPHNITYIKNRIGQSSKTSGKTLNNFVHRNFGKHPNFGGRRTKKRTRRHRKHHK